MFSVIPTIDGYEVVADDTGRPVLSRDTRREANGAAQRLNRMGSAELRRALSTSGGTSRRRNPRVPDNSVWDWHA